MNRLAAGQDRRLDHRRHAAIAALAGRRPDADGLIGQPHRQRLTVGLAIGDDRLDAQLAAGTNDAQRDLAAIGDQDLLEHALLERGVVGRDHQRADHLGDDRAAVLGQLRRRSGRPATPDRSRRRPTSGRARRRSPRRRYRSVGGFRRTCRSSSRRCGCRASRRDRWCGCGTGCGARQFGRARTHRIRSSYSMPSSPSFVVGLADAPIARRCGVYHGAAGRSSP